MIRALAVLVFSGVVLYHPAFADDDFAALKREKIGELKIGMAADAVTTALGPPSKTGKNARAEFDGGYHQLWQYPDLGVTLSMSSEKKKSPQSVESITASSPCAMKTTKGIGIGSSLAALNKAYGKERNPEESRDDNFVVGSIYGGVQFAIKQGKVSEIFVGASAE